MQHFPLVQKQLISIIDTLVKGIIVGVCEADVSVLKAQCSVSHSELRERNDTEMEFTAALEKLTKETVDEISQLFCRLFGGAQGKAPLSYLQRQRLKRKKLSVESRFAKRRSSVKPRSSGISLQNAATEPSNKEGRLEELQHDTFSEDSAVSTHVEVPAVQQMTVLKIELLSDKEQGECSTQQREQREEAMYNQAISAMQPISKEESASQTNCTQVNSSDALEIKISAAQSFDCAKGTNMGQAEKTSARTGKASGGTSKGTTALNLNKCETCGKTFTYLNNLKRHQRTFHSGDTPHACQDCGERFGSKRLLRVHLREHKVEKPHACNLCKKVFRLPNHLKKHMTSHTNERPFACTTCSKTFALLSTLRAHERTHSDEKTFMCSQCDMSFLTKSYLDYHLRVHTGEKPYTCMHCGKTFAQKSNLRVHERLHTGEKPFCCEECGESFIHANSYKSHKQLHTGRNDFCCEHCGKGFRRGTHLKTHLLTHTGIKSFPCDLCPKTFALKGSLKAHRLTHTGERNFVCNVCNKSFTQASSLGKHKRTHTGEKPYLCTFCNKSFCQSSHLHYHYRASHSGPGNLAETATLT